MVAVTSSQPSMTLKSMLYSAVRNSVPMPCHWNTVLGDDRAAEQRGDVERGDGGQRDQRGPQRVPDQHRPRDRPFDRASRT